MNNINKRALISFSGQCSLNCKHCYTYELNLSSQKSDEKEIPEIINKLNASDEFDVIYLSKSRENFLDEQAGIELIDKLFHSFHKHIFVITRKVLSSNSIKTLSSLSRTMKDSGCSLIIAVSIPAGDSYGFTEDKDQIDSPQNRCEFIKDLHMAGIKTVFMARPIFPNKFVPTNEVVDLICDYSKHIDAVVASGIAINKPILDRLKLTEDDFEYLSGNNEEYLIGSEAKDIRYVDVSKELKVIEQSCIDKSLPFFTHSMHAINHIVGEQF